MAAAQSVNQALSGLLSGSKPPTASTSDDVVIKSWYAENRADNHYKFYLTMFSDEGHVIFAWGRIGTRGQAKVQKLPSATDAESVAMKQHYAKLGKGYSIESKDAGLPFVVKREVLEQAMTTSDTWDLRMARSAAAQDPKFAGQQEVAGKHYLDFITAGERLMSRIANEPAEVLFEDWMALQAAWKELEGLHGTAAATISLTAQMFQNKLAGN